MASLNIVCHYGIQQKNGILKYFNKSQVSKVMPRTHSKISTSETLYKAPFAKKSQKYLFKFMVSNKRELNMVFLLFMSSTANQLQLSHMTLLICFTQEKKNGTKMLKRQAIQAK